MRCLRAENLSNHSASALPACHTRLNRRPCSCCAPQRGSGDPQGCPRPCGRPLARCEHAHATNFRLPPALSHSRTLAAAEAPASCVNGIAWFWWSCYSWFRLLGLFWRNRNKSDIENEMLMLPKVYTNSKNLTKTSCINQVRSCWDSVLEREHQHAIRPAANRGNAWLQLGGSTTRRCVTERRAAVYGSMRA